jgi:hyperosmotically inducible protein
MSADVEPSPVLAVSCDPSIMITMKKSLILVSVLSLAFVGCEKKSMNEPSTTEKAEAAVKNAAHKTGDAIENAAAKTKDAAIDAKDAIHDKLVDWKLTPSDIKADLAKGGRVVRSKAGTAATKSGEVFDNARIVTVINAKLVGDGQLSALKINVDADQGGVTLKGTVNSVELIGRAVTLALDTDGVTQVVSLLTVSM